VLNVNQHAPAVDVADLEIAELGVPHARRVQDHEHRPIGEILRPIDQTGDLLRGENHRESSRDLRKGEVLRQVGALERLDEEEPEGGDVELDRARPELPLAQQICLISAQVALIESVGWPAEILGESFDRLDVVPSRLAQRPPANQRAPGREERLGSTRSILRGRPRLFEREMKPV
jgi:hypothetical protein